MAGDWLEELMALQSFSWHRWIVALVAYGSLGLIVNASTPARAETIRVLALGDSLTAGYGLAAPDSFTVQLERALRAEGLDVTVINAGVSGDTSAGGKARLDWSLADDPQAAIIELGANDGLRGLDPVQTQANLNDIVARLTSRRVKVLLTGMLAPPNLGRDYGARFAAVYPAVAKEHGIRLYPFFLDGVAGQAHLNQADGIHPNPEGVRIVVARILPAIRALLADRP